ncbi:MAG: hypothetical protein CMM52_17450 [Rhodospirillaceae bacterium]|nr:hypothetical protein [Rhodospirillaceae bacterium]
MTNERLPNHDIESRTCAKTLNFRGIVDIYFIEDQMRQNQKTAPSAPDAVRQFGLIGQKQSG